MSFAKLTADERALVKAWGAGETRSPGGTVDAAVIRALLMRSNPLWLLPRGPKKLMGAAIVGELDLSFLEFDGLSLLNCQMLSLNIQGSRINGHLDLSGSTVSGTCDGKGDRKAIIGDGADVRGTVCLSLNETMPFSAKGSIGFVGVQLGDLDLRGACLNNPGGDALHADRLITRGAVFLSKGFTAKGAVRCLGAHIGNDCSLDNSVIDGMLSLNGAKLERNLYLRNTTITGGPHDPKNVKSPKVCVDFMGLTV